MTRLFLFVPFLAVFVQCFCATSAAIYAAMFALFQQLSDHPGASYSTYWLQQVFWWPNKFLEPVNGCLQQILLNHQLEVPKKLWRNPNRTMNELFYSLSIASAKCLPFSPFRPFLQCLLPCLLQCMLQCVHFFSSCRITQVPPTALTGCSRCFDDQTSSWNLLTDAFSKYCWIISWRFQKNFGETQIEPWTNYSTAFK